MRVGAIASLLVAAGADSGDAGNLPAVGGFTLNFPGEDLFASPGQVVDISPGGVSNAIWQLSNGITAQLWSIGLAFPACCTSNLPSCNFVVDETGLTVPAQGQPDNYELSPVNNITVPSPATEGQTISYHITLLAHCGAVSVGLRFTPVESNTSATAVYRLTAN